MTKKGKYGVTLGIVAAAALVFGILKMPTLVVLILAYALLAEKDDWLTRQSLYAFVLTVSYYVIDLIISGGFGALSGVFGWLDFYRLQQFTSGTQVVLQSALYILLIAASILALVRVLNNKDAGIPLVSKLVDLATGAAPTPKPVPATKPTAVQPMHAPVPQPVASPMSAPIPQPVPQPAPAPAPQPTSPVPPVSGWLCGCGTHNDGNFCVSCGQRKQL